MKWFPHVLIFIVGFIAFNWIQPWVYRKISDKLLRWIVTFLITLIFAIGVLWIGNSIFHWKCNPHIVARGYTEYVTIQDYPMRGRPVFLHMRKNKWWDKQTNEIFSYNLELPNDEGTRLSAEFVAFLKDEGGDNSPVD